MMSAMGPIWLPAGGDAGANDVWMAAQQRQQREWKLWPPPGHTGAAGEVPRALTREKCQRSVIGFAVREIAERLHVLYPRHLNTPHRRRDLHRALEQTLLDASHDAGLWDRFAAWLSFHLQAWALDEMRRTLGEAAVDHMPPDERRAMLARCLAADRPTPLLTRCGRLTQRFAQMVARQVLAVLDRPDTSWPGMEILLGWRPPQQPCCETGITSLYQQLRKAVAIADFVCPAGGQWPQSDVTTPRRRLQAVAQVGRPPTEVEPFSDDAELAASQVWAAEQVQAMADLTADVLDMIVICWLQHAKHPEDLVTVTVDQLLALRGLQKHKGGGGRRGGYPRACRREIAQQIGILTNIWINVAEMTVTEVVQGARGESRRPVKKRMESPAVVVTSRAGTVTATIELDADTWRVRPGDVFAPFFLGAVRQTALLARQALEYDPYRQPWEKRLTRYFTWIWGIRRVHEEGQLRFQVRTLLAAVAKHPDSRSLRGARKRFEAALDLLREDGVIGAWEYADDQLKWLERTVLVTPPRLVIEHYARIRRPKKKCPSALPPARS